ncbi:hypothetical protein TEA_004041 [Camellia sinensis var. sinensis]|uniref:Uncharacterized protein n=1 Tax=Camellia sinensis var. sinensis TaxID=542762 RepID=A0A4S4ESH4_CAMSN|nr:hypothetical protein TEA_004041 [Camellia sinensis var. sinensis]
MDWPNRTSQPSRSNASLQLNRPNETSQPSRSNGSSQPSWSHPSSHAPSHVPHPQPQESEVNPQFEDDLDEDWLREEEMQRTDESTKRNTRGITRMVEVWNLTPEERIMLTFNKDLQAVSTEGGIFSRFIGTIARKPHLCPIKYKNWHEVPDQYKEDCWNIIESKFAIPQDERRDMIRHRILKSMGEKWRNWKCSLKAKYYDETKTAAQIVATAPLTVNLEHYADLVAYWFSKEGQELSATNKERRREQTSAHTGGSKTYAQHAYDMATDGCSGIPDQASPRTHQRSSFGSHEMQPSNRACYAFNEMLFVRFVSLRLSGKAWRFDRGFLVPSGLRPVKCKRGFASHRILAGKVWCLVIGSSFPSDLRLVDEDEIGSMHYFSYLVLNIHTCCQFSYCGDEIGKATAHMEAVNYSVGQDEEEEAILASSTVQGGSRLSKNWRRAIS